LEALFYAPPCRVEQTARLFLSPEAASHPLIARTVELFGEAEAEVVRQSQKVEAIMAERAMKKIDVRSRKVIENKAGQTRKIAATRDVIENKTVM
jgi:hypothetical protein